MTDKSWNPNTALIAATPFFLALPHLEQAVLTTCGGESLRIWFDCVTSELVAETSEENEVGRIHIDVMP